MLNKILTALEAVTTGEVVDAETVKQRYEICIKCNKYNSKTESCNVCGCGIVNDRNKLFNLLRYKERLPRYGCKHPRRKRGQGWPYDQNSQLKGETKMLINFKGRGMNIRQLPDGLLMIPRPNKDLERYLDTMFDRVKGELKWFPKVGESTITQDFRNKFRDKVGYIVGKGPSLDKLESKYFDKTGPVIALNDSIHKVESTLYQDSKNPIFCIQQDAANKENCLPERGVLFLAKRCKGWYGDLPIERKYLFDPVELGARHDNMYSLWCAVKILDIMGCSEIVFVACDAYINKNCEYADVIGHSSTKFGRPNRYLNQAIFILKELAKERYKYSFIIPGSSQVTPEESQPEEASDTEQPQSDSPTEHHEPSHSQSSSALPESQDSPEDKESDHDEEQ